MFKIPLINTKLVLETDEYDPVPITRLNNHDEWSFSDSESSEASSNDDDEAREQEQKDLKEHLGDEEYDALVQAAAKEGGNGKRESRQERKERKREKWVKREEELVDSMRKVGDWVEGRVARVRVERREISTKDGGA